ncbi:TPA: fimbrial chaperone [Salmonella enterica subsp. enterica serovar Virchow]
MNKYGKAALAALLSLAVSGQAMAAFVLNGTRYIFEEGKKNISFEVKNESDRNYGGQVWIDNVRADDNTVHLVPAPPFFRVDAKGKQIVRIMKMDGSLPADRESLFWLNVQEVPPKPKADGGNVIALAMNTRVKVFYRPKAIADGRKDAEKQLKVEQRDGMSWLKNPTPYYMAVTKVTAGGKVLTPDTKTVEGLTNLAPFSSAPLGKTVSGPVTVTAINDWGGEETYTL